MIFEHFEHQDNRGKDQKVLALSADNGIITATKSESDLYIGHENKFGGILR